MTEREEEDESAAALCRRRPPRPLLPSPQNLDPTRNPSLSLYPSSPPFFQPTQWSGTCWYVHEYLRYEFAFEFETPATYPATAPEVKIPALDGRTAKMYRGGAICLTLHFKPLWSRNAPHFGVAHALCLGLAPWLAAEVREKVLLVSDEKEEEEERKKKGTKE